MSNLDKMVDELSNIYQSNGNIIRAKQLIKNIIKLAEREKQKHNVGSAISFVKTSTFRRIFNNYYPNTSTVAPPPSDFTDFSGIIAMDEASDASNMKRLSKSAVRSAAGRNNLLLQQASEKFKRAVQEDGLGNIINAIKYYEEGLGLLRNIYPDNYDQNPKYKQYYNRLTELRTTCPPSKVKKCKGKSGFGCCSGRPTYDGGAKRKKTRRKTVRRKTVRRKTVRRKTVRRKKKKTKRNYSRLK